MSILLPSPFFVCISGCTVSSVCEAIPSLPPSPPSHVVLCRQASKALIHVAQAAIQGARVRLVDVFKELDRESKGSLDTQQLMRLLQR